MRGVQRFFVGVSAAAFLLSGITAVITSTSASASISPNPKLVGTYNVKVKVNPAFGGTKLSGQITLASDGTWTGNVLSHLGCSEKGSWLATATVLSLSDLDPGNHCDPKGTGMTWMITIGTKGTLGSATAPGYLNVPYNFNATWDATLAPHVPPAPHSSSSISPSAKLVGTYNATLIDSVTSATTSIALNNDGTWTSSTASIFICGTTGTWLSSGKTVALSVYYTGAAHVHRRPTAGRGWRRSRVAQVWAQPRSLVTSTAHIGGTRTGTPPTLRAGSSGARSQGETATMVTSSINSRAIHPAACGGGPGRHHRGDGSFA